MHDPGLGLLRFEPELGQDRPKRRKRRPVRRKRRVNTNT